MVRLEGLRLGVYIYKVITFLNKIRSSKMPHDSRVNKPKPKPSPKKEVKQPKKKG
tara:strand:- start:949 stop:1113 length:165 start_codon:yes stop_codon:yes gene_type:complete